MDKNEAIKIIRSNFPAGRKMLCEALEILIPELKESEDENVRKHLLRHFRNKTKKEWDGMPIKNIISWLEKQKDHEDELEKAYKTADEVQYRKGFEDGVASVKPAEWSEDKKIRKEIIQSIQDNMCVIHKDKCIAWLEKQSEKINPCSGTSFEYNGHTWGMCARDNGVEILIDGHLKGRVFTDDSNAKEMFIKALERVEEQNGKGYKLTDCDKNSWWEDFKAYTSCIMEQKSTWSEKDDSYYQLICEILNVEHLGSVFTTSGIPYFCSGTVNCSEIRDWLKSLKDRLSFHD